MSRDLKVKHGEEEEAASAASAASAAPGAPRFSSPEGLTDTSTQTSCKNTGQRSPQEVTAALLTAKGQTDT